MKLGITLITYLALIGETEAKCSGHDKYVCKNYQNTDAKGNYNNHVFSRMDQTDGPFPTYYVPLSIGPNHENKKMILSTDHSETSVISEENDQNKPGKYKAFDTKKAYKYKDTLIQHYFKRQSTNYYVREGVRSDQMTVGFHSDKWNNKFVYYSLYQVDTKNAKVNNFDGSIGLLPKYRDQSNMLLQMKTKGIINKSIVSLYFGKKASSIQFGGWDSRAVKGGHIHAFYSDKYGAVKVGKMKLRKAK